MTTPESNVNKDIAAEIAAAIENGDLFDEDSNTQLTNIELVNGVPPARLSLFVNGFFYVFTIDHRYGFDIATGEPTLQAKDPYQDL